MPSLQTRLAFWLLLLCFGSFLPACSSGDTDAQEAEASSLTAENDALKEEVEALKAQVAELKNTPAVLLSEVDGAVKKNDLGLAKQHLATLQEKYAQAPEALAGARLVTALEDKQKAEAREAARIAALGLKALKVSNVFKHDGLSLQVSEASIAKVWTFDRYGDNYHYRESERGSKFVHARLTYTSKKNDPALFGLGAYVEENGKLAQLGTLEYRFVRWMEYGTFLGNEADFRNDFAHTATIPFSAATEISDEKLKRPVYLVATKQGCHTRSFDRFGNPPVSYGGYCNTLKQILTVDDFKNGDYAVLKRIN